jgi:acetyl-CoA carboxylase carboxyl transferase alpha subunit
LKQADDVELPAPSLPSDRWALVETIRQPSWPTGTRWLNALAERHFEFRGDRAGSDDPTLVCVAAEIDKKPWIVLAQNRLAGDGLITPGGYRKALRVLRIASRLRLPVLSLIDTPGAQVGPEADRGDVAYWIAECFAALLELPIPVIALVVGQGSSGGALALSVADRTYMLESSMFSVISPEAAAAILADDSRQPSELSDALKLTAADAFTLKLIDGVVPGSNPARRARAAQVRRVRRLLRNEVARLEQLQPDELLARRRQRYLELTRHLILPRESRPELDPTGSPGLR